MSFLIGETLRLSFATRVDKVATDPDAATLAIAAPSGASLAMAWPGAPGGITKPATGSFRAAFVVSEAGTWRYRIETTGAAAGAREGTFVVEPSKMPA